MNHIKDLIILVLSGTVVFLLIGAPQVERVSQVSARDLFGSIADDNEIRVLLQQVKDFAEIEKKGSVGRVMYQPTGEVFEGKEEILRALPAKKERLVTLLMEREGY